MNIKIAERGLYLDIPPKELADRFRNMAPRSSGIQEPDLGAFVGIGFWDCMRIATTIEYLLDELEKVEDK